VSIASSYLEKNKHWEENVIKYLFKNKDDSDGTFESKSKLKEQILSEFPVFGLNEDYMKALSIIIWDKITEVQQELKERL
jgi:hypothetical protein